MNFQERTNESILTIVSRWISLDSLAYIRES